MTDVIDEDALRQLYADFAAETQLDLFTFNDHRILEVLNLARSS
jgi:gentisate 1,2-dioxygenase